MLESICVAFHRSALQHILRLQEHGFCKRGEITPGHGERKAKGSLLVAMYLYVLTGARTHVGHAYSNTSYL